MNKPLFLHEEVVLLSLDDKTGNFVSAATQIAVACAVMAELALRKRINVTDDNKKVVTITSQQSTGDGVLDECLNRIAESKTTRGLSHWVATFGAIQKLSKRIALALCKKKILRHEVHTILWLFEGHRFPMINGNRERSIKSRMKKLMFGQSTDHNERTTVLIAICKHSGLLNSNFEKERLRRNQKRIDRVANGELFAARATKDAADATQSTVSMAVLIPTLMGS